MSKIFIDTNILIYSMDRNDPKKKKVCRKLLDSLDDEESGVISTQVLQEFYVAAVKKLKAEPLIVKDIVRSFYNFSVIVITPEMIESAIDVSILNSISFWDSLIVTAAEFAKCDVLWTEDFNHGQVIRGVKIINPIKQ